MEPLKTPDGDREAGHAKRTKAFLFFVVVLILAINAALFYKAFFMGR